VSTTLLDLPPTDPIERPWPPEQTEFSNVIPWPCRQRPLHGRPVAADITTYTHSSGIDSNTIILVITIRTGNSHIGGAPNVEAVGVLPLAVTGSVINGHASNSQSVCAVDADGLDGGVADMQVGDGRVGEVVGVEELGLRHAARATLAIPVLCTASVEDSPGRALDVDRLAADLQQWPSPRGIAPGSDSFEDDLSWPIQTAASVEGVLRRNLHSLWYHPRD
jgi:hypothetical protein